MARSWFSPRDGRDKSPYGAVPLQTPVRFTFRPEDAAVVRCELLCHEEFTDRWTQTELPAAQEDGKRIFSGIYAAPAQAELVWYHFRLTWADGGSCCYGREGLAPWDRVTAWQLTVYEDTPTPEWFGRGVTYQIFPDRFRRSAVRETAGLVGQRTLHESWDEPVEFRPNAAGEITCSDFYGGDLAGITQSLGELADLGVTTLYLNPIFEAASNHRYDTADYHRIDPLLGTEEDFRALCSAAAAHGIRVLLDGVFNHTGARSRYFNADGFYPEPGAAQSRESPYYPWYRFSRYPGEYDSWWGIRNLPAVEENEESYAAFIADAPDSVVRHWLRCGASGWRLDVADELPDGFIARIRRAMEEEKKDAFLLGEVWEDGSNKIAYSQRRRYLLGRETHALMNYPFRTAALAYLRGGDAADFREAMETLRENYPPAAFRSAMNFLSTHDTPRLLTALGIPGEAPQSREERAVYRLSPEDRARGLARVRLAALLQFTFPGTPSVYYGDEIGMEGFEDPFNRAPYAPPGDTALRGYYARLAALRRERAALQSGDFAFLHAEGSLLAFRRGRGAAECVSVLHAGDAGAQLTLPWEADGAEDLLTLRRFSASGGALTLSISAREGLLLVQT